MIDWKKRSGQLSDYIFGSTQYDPFDIETLQSENPGDNKQIAREILAPLLNHYNQNITNQRNNEVSPWGDYPMPEGQDIGERSVSNDRTIREVLNNIPEYKGANLTINNSNFDSELLDRSMNSLTAEELFTLSEHAATLQAGEFDGFSWHEQYPVLEKEDFNNNGIIDKEDYMVALERSAYQGGPFDSKLSSPTIKKIVQENFQAYNNQPFDGVLSKEIVDTALSLVGEDTYSYPAVDEKYPVNVSKEDFHLPIPSKYKDSDTVPARENWICTAASCKIYGKAGLENFLPKDPATGMLSENNDFVIDSLKKDKNWESISVTNDRSEKVWDINNVAPGDWMFFDLMENERSSKHSAVVVGSDDQFIYVADDGGSGSNMRIKGHAKADLLSANWHLNSGQIFRLNPSSDWYMENTGINILDHTAEN